jgi:hypothetical protein
MPIVASRGAEIERLLDQLNDPRRRAGAALRLRTLGSRVVPHASDGLARLAPEARKALREAMADVDTADARALTKRLAGFERDRPPAFTRPGGSPSDGSGQGQDAAALETLGQLPPPRANERASLSRERGEAHLALARAGSRLARKELLASLVALDASRARLYCEAAGLIGDAEFLAPLARLAQARPEASRAIFEIAARERITARSKAMKALPEAVQVAVAKALVGV